MFVLPSYQRQGIGQALIRECETKALDWGVTYLLVPASFTSERFYAKLGYKTLREQFDGDERTFIMEREQARAS